MKEIIDRAIAFYGLDEKYKVRAYECADHIKAHCYEQFMNAVNELITCPFNEFGRFWEKKLYDVDEIHPFANNLALLLGCDFFKENLDRYGFDDEQRKILIMRVKRGFELDLEWHPEGITNSQLVWTYHFIHCRILQYGRLQFEYLDKNIVHLHIPREGRLDYDDILASVRASREGMKKYFGIDDPEYRCNSWLVSNQISDIVSKDSNIYKFYSLFDSTDGSDCLSALYNFVFNIQTLEIPKYPIESLPENTSLRKTIKRALLDGKVFYTGMGVMKKNIDK